MKKKILPVLIVVLLIIILSAVYVLSIIKERYEPTKETMDLTEYYDLQGGDDVAVIIDTYKTEEKALLINGRPYVSADFVKTYLNSRFYYDNVDNLLLLAEGDQLLTAACDSCEYTVDASSQVHDAAIFTLQEETCYLDLAFVKLYSDFSFSYFEDPSRLVISLPGSEYESAAITADTQVRYRGGVKSPILTAVSSGDRVSVHARDEKWTEVATEDGIVGYVLSKYVSEGTTIAYESDYTEKISKHMFVNDTISMVWHQVTGQAANKYLDSVLEDSGNINVISPTWFYLNDDQGNIMDFSSSIYVSACHDRGIAVWGLVSNLENPNVSTAAVLRSTTNRRHLIDQLIDAALACGMDGINVDFESLKADAVGDSFIQFIRELAIRCHEHDLVLSVDNYVMSSYTAFYNREEQAKFADYVVIMAYDEHYNGSEDGSVASLPWVEEGLTKTMAYVPANQIILGNPFYTRIWKLTSKNGGEVEIVDEENHSELFDISSEVAGMTSAANTVAANNAAPVYSAAEGQNYAEWKSEGALYRVWLEDETSMTSRMELIQKYDLAGAAFWKYGFENDAIWKVIDSYLK